METAGRAVIFSGITVAIGLLALVALPLPFLRSMGYGGLLIPLVSTLAAITLLPVVLAKLGPRLDWPPAAPTKASRPGPAGPPESPGHRWVAAEPIGCGPGPVPRRHGYPAGLLRRQHHCQVRRGQGGPGCAPGPASARSCCRTRSWSIAAPTPSGRARAGPGPPASTALSRPTRRTARRNETAIVEVVQVPDSGSDEGEANLEAVRGAAHGAGPDVAVWVASRPPTPTSSTPSTAASR